MGRIFRRFPKSGAQRSFIAAVLICLRLIGLSAPVQADSTPVQPTTTGLAPGVANNTVRMTAEKVDLKITESDHSVHALVTASFDLFNRGPTVNLTVGFPAFMPTYYPVPGGVAAFQPNTFVDFKASTGATDFAPTVQTLASTSPADAHYAGSWYVWQMDYPSNQTTNVQVQYDQIIGPSDRGLVYVTYILSTGALWDGTIGDATITMETSTGGALIPPSDAQVQRLAELNLNAAGRPQEQFRADAARPTSSTSEQVSWHLTDIKPSFDPYVAYVPGQEWQNLIDTDRRIATDSPSVDDYAAATQALLDVIGSSGDGLPVPLWRNFREVLPSPLVDRYERVQGWVEQGKLFDPNRPAGFEALGDLEYALEVPPRQVGECVPILAPELLQRAVDLGSTTARARLDAVNNRIQNFILDRPHLNDCCSPLPVALPPSGDTTAGQSGVINCPVGRLIGQGMVAFPCDNGVGYDIGPGSADDNFVSTYDPGSPQSGLTGGPWPATVDLSGAARWMDDQGRACEFQPKGLGGTISCNGGGSSSEGGQPPAATTPGASAEEEPSSSRSTLTDNERADILAAVDRANAAWTAASESLDGSALDGAVAGQLLNDDLAEVDSLRSQGHTRKNVNTSFTVTGVTLDAPGQGIVHTHETWYAEIYDASSGRLLQRTAPASYDETYTVENHGGGWIVTKNDI